MPNQPNDKNFNDKWKKVLLDKNEKTGSSKPTPTLLAIIGAIIILTAVLGFTYKNAQEIYVGDTKVGIISGTDTTDEEFIELLTAKIKGEEGTNVQINEEITLHKVRASKGNIISLDYALYKTTEIVTYKTESAVIVVDGEEIVILATNEDAESVLEEIKSKYIAEDANINEVSFVQNVEITPKFVEEEELSTKQVAMDILTNTTEKEKKYEIQEGDTLYQIAIDHGIQLEDLYRANPELTEDTKLKIGQEINLIVPTPLVSVKTVEEITYSEEIKRDTETTYNDSQYKTYRKVLTEGSDGEKQVVASIIKINGFEEERVIVSEEVVVDPVVQVVEVGTLETPPKAAIGNFIYPVATSISSGYGYRSGEFHKGIDLAAPAGTPIKASDGGTVIYSGWNSGGYGNVVKIDHGNGFVTLYAHNSSNTVSVGQKVAQGEVIGYVGNTGNSSGNHCHFEIIKDGVNQNPVNYL